MTTTIEGQPTSAEVRESLAAEGRPVLLAFSRGKDSIAAWLALRDAGVDVIPYHMYLVPDLAFVEESLAYFADWFGYKIHNIPHPSLYRWINSLTFQAPERLAIIEAARLPSPEYASIIGMLRTDLGLPADTWIADGVRACDSPVRRLSIARHGPMKVGSRKVSAIWDWSVAEVRERIEAAGVELPVEYEWFGRSFDGLDYRFLGPLRDHAPDDYQRVLDWFPLAGLELFRREMMTCA